MKMFYMQEHVARSLLKHDDFHVTYQEKLASKVVVSARACAIACSLQYFSEEGEHRMPLALIPCFQAYSITLVYSFYACSI